MRLWASSSATILQVFSYAESAIHCSKLSRSLLSFREMHWKKGKESSAADMKTFVVVSVIASICIRDSFIEAAIRFFESGLLKMPSWACTNNLKMRICTWLNGPSRKSCNSRSGDWIVHKAGVRCKKQREVRYLPKETLTTKGRRLQQVGWPKWQRICQSR